MNPFLHLFGLLAEFTSLWPEDSDPGFLLAMSWNHHQVVKATCSSLTCVLSINGGVLTHVCLISCVTFKMGLILQFSLESSQWNMEHLNIRSSWLIRYVQIYSLALTPKRCVVLVSLSPSFSICEKAIIIFAKISLRRIWNFFD